MHAYACCVCVHVIVSNACVCMVCMCVISCACLYMACKHKLLSGLFSNVCVGERECGAKQQWCMVQHLLGLNSVEFKVQHQNGRESVLSTWPPLQVLSRFSGVYLCQVCSSVLYENMQVCSMWAKVTISVAEPQAPNLSILVAWMYCSALV